MLMFLPACSFAPFSSNHSARTLGKGNISVQGGATGDLTLPYARIGYGISENTDFGLLAESLGGNFLAGGWLKYAFINNNQGLSLSAEASMGGSLYDKYFYAGPTLGYKLKWWEPYISARYNYVVPNDNNYDMDLEYFGKYNFEGKTNYQYGLVTFGNTLWATDWLGLNLNANVSIGDMAFAYYGAGIVVEF